MDIIAQLQEQANKIAFLTFTTVGTFQRDAPAVQVSKEYPDPIPTPTTEDLTAFAEQPKAMAAALVQAAKQVTLSGIFRRRCAGVGIVRAPCKQ